MKTFNYDVIIVGGGMTGICAAIASARNGAKTALVHDRHVLGGNASSEIRMHICGANANMKKPELTEGGIVHELMLSNKRVNDSYNFSIWDAVLFDAVKKEENLTLYLNTTMFSVAYDNGVVKAIECYQTTTEKRFMLSASFFADCTGNGTLCAFVNADYRMGSEGKDEFNEPDAPDEANNDRMGNTLLFKAADRGHPVKFIPPVDVMHFTEEQLKFRKHCAKPPRELLDRAQDSGFDVMFSGYCPDYGYWWIEIPGEKENIIEEYEDIRDQLVKAIYGIWDHIKNGGDHGADNYELTWVGMLPGVRESRRIECDYMLNENDVLSNRRFEDKVAYGGWAIDNHKGLFAFDKMPSLAYDIEGSYDIPYRSYCVKGMKNLFVGGRCMGASKLAMSSSRVMGTCAVGGQAIGTAAALLSVSDSKDIREIDINELQQTLLKDDCYLPELLNTDENDLARNARIMASSEMKGYLAANVINGITRSMNGDSNQWRSKGKEEWLCLEFEQKTKVSEVRIVFDSDFYTEKKITLSSTRQNQQVLGVPEQLVKDFEISLVKDGVPVITKYINDNFQRLVRIPFSSEVCDAVKISFTATNGDEAVRVFEVRVY